MFGSLKITNNLGSTYTCKVNPETVKVGRKIITEVEDKGHTAGKMTKHDTYDPDSLSFEFIVDGTLLDPGLSVFSVKSNLDSLNTCVYKFQDGEHESPICTISFGGAIDGSKTWRCTGFDVTYTLFNSFGMVLRAKVSLTFQEHVTAESIKNRYKINSPDMSHLHTVREGDNLMGLSKDVYGSIKYYMAIAEHNGLTNFRDLEIGSVIELPPLN